MDNQDSVEILESDEALLEEIKENQNLNKLLSMDKFNKYINKDKNEINN